VEKQKGGTSDALSFSSFDEKQIECENCTCCGAVGCEITCDIGGGIGMVGENG
jgi:hypothetical protein